ncbi:sulfatase-like hydrolase/transferase [Bdellovibrio bacteriovorus]|uniref:sulfatase-like hydrolase/transferase n=1 Tax=Bdellovibrio bacteriovorus TaxID=959 RepID=UPI0035A5E463
MRKIILTLTLLLLSLVQLSCQTHDRKSILIIAVDELTISDVNCNQEAPERSGFQLLCKESVRFTHAFSPSPLSVPALTSLLTGLYPYQHKVRHNGGPGLAAEFEVASEVALDQDYRTSFFSGGAPVFRRTGLNQGFELFDDNIVPSFRSLIRPFKQNADAFRQWVHQDAAGMAFFSVIYIPDLLFTTTETITDLGETRNLSFESQLDELDESLYELFQDLKSSGRWDKTTILLVGLNGHTGNDRPKELSTMNLHGENTQVALFIKPSQKQKRDEAIHWKIDQNVSLVDVGRTVFHLLGESIVDQTSSAFPALSLVEVLKSPNANWPEDRPLLLESGWALWRKAGPLKTAAISNHVLLINDEKPRLYNTLVDRFETNPLPLLQESILPTTQRLQSLLYKNQFPAFFPLASEWTTKLSLPFSRWMRPDQEALLLKDLKRLLQIQPGSLDLLNWTAQIALNQKDWETLKHLGSKNKVSTWQFIAEKNLGTKNAKVSDSCFDLISAKSINTDNLKNCGDPLFLEWIDWIRADARGLSRDTQKKRFERSFKNYMLDQQIQRTNIAAGLIWDTSRDNVFAPSRVELALSLPEFSKLRSQVYKNLTVEDL